MELRGERATCYDGERVKREKNFGLVICRRETERRFGDFFLKRFGWKAGRGSARFEVSHVPDLNVGAVQVNLLSARGGASA